MAATELLWIAVYYSIGRPLWKSIIASVIEKNPNDLKKSINGVRSLSFAKITCGKEDEITPEAIIATLSIRLGLSITGSTTVSSEFVANYMADVLSISENRDYLAISYPMEPALVSGAFWLMNRKTSKSGDRKDEIKKTDLLSILNNKLLSGSVLRGYRGEILTRFIMTTGFDFCVQQLITKGQKQIEYSELTPVLLESYLRTSYGDGLISEIEKSCETDSEEALSKARVAKLQNLLVKCQHEHRELTARKLDSYLRKVYGNELISEMEKACMITPAKSPSEIREANLQTLLGGCQIFYSKLNADNIDEYLRKVYGETFITEMEPNCIISPEMKPSERREATLQQLLSGREIEYFELSAELLESYLRTSYGDGLISRMEQSCIINLEITPSKSRQANLQQLLRGRLIEYPELTPIKLDAYIRTVYGNEFINEMEESCLIRSDKKLTGTRKANLHQLLGGWVRIVKWIKMNKELNLDRAEYYWTFGCALWLKECCKGIDGAIPVRLANNKFTWIFVQDKNYTVRDTKMKKASIDTAMPTVFGQQPCQPYLSIYHQYGDVETERETKGIQNLFSLSYTTRNRGNNRPADDQMKFVVGVCGLKRAFIDDATMEQLVMLRDGMKLAEESDDQMECLEYAGERQMEGEMIIPEQFSERQIASTNQTENA